MGKMQKTTLISILFLSLAACGDNIHPPTEEPDLTGPQGEQGANGDTGSQGPIGPQGPQGEQGPSGLDGENGVCSQECEDGHDGAQGPKGDTGDTGPVGPQGPQGPQGAQGPAGQNGQTLSAGNLVAGDAQNPSVTFTVPSGGQNVWLHFNVTGGGTNEVFDTWDNVAQGSCAKGTNQVDCDRVKFLAAGSHTIKVTNSGTTDRATLVVLGL